jgi:acid phosphatase class B
MLANYFKVITQHAKNGRTDLTANNRYWRTRVVRKNDKLEIDSEFAGKLLHAKDHSGNLLYNVDGKTPATFRLDGIGDGTTITWFFEKDAQEYTITEDLYGYVDETYKSVFSTLPRP